MEKNIRTVEEIAEMNKEREGKGWKPIVSAAGDCYVVMSICMLFSDGDCRIDAVSDVAYFSTEGAAAVAAGRMTAERAGLNACFVEKFAYVVEARVVR